MKHFTLNAQRFGTCGSCRGTGRSGPRPFLVRWQNEDSGWDAVAVIADTAEDASEIVEKLTGCPVSQVAETGG